MTLREFRDLLLTVTPEVYHLEALEAGEEYIVWSETGGNALAADGRRSQVVRHIQVDFWTTQEYPTLLETLMETLGSNDCVSVSEPIPDYDEETKMQRFIVECEVL